MATRQNRFLIKRSNVPGNVPSPGQILLGELALNTADVILYASGTTTNSILPIGWDRLSITGGTVNGNVTINGSLNSTTISATTYLNLPLMDIYVTGGTYSSNTLTLTRNDNNSVVVTGFTTGIKSNSVSGGSFAGNPKKYTVVFDNPYPNTNYSISITGEVNRSFTYESKTTTGFTINANANTAFIPNVDWITMSFGEF
jgi:hypothetical protein